MSFTQKNKNLDLFIGIQIPERGAMASPTEERRWNFLIREKRGKTKQKKENWKLKETRGLPRITINNQED